MLRNLNKRLAGPIHTVVTPYKPVSLRISRLVCTTAPHRANYRRFGDAPRQSLGGFPGARNAQSPKPLFANSSNPILSRFRKPPIIILVGLAGGVGYYILNLEKVPQTGRWRFIDVTPEQEQQMGAQSLQEIMGEYKGKLLPKSHPTSRYVSQVIGKIIQANDLQAGPNGWETHVVHDDETKNAFVLPNGSIFVFSGILPIAKDEDGLAVILGHEIAHQVARHSAERMSSLKVLMGLSLLLESLGIDPGISRIGLNLLMSLPNSRKNESEADFIGLQLATKACFDPRAATGLWTRMEQTEGSGKKGAINLNFLSTHPSTHNRIEKVTKWAEEIVRDRPYSCAPLRDQANKFQQLTQTKW